MGLITVVTSEMLSYFSLICKQIFYEKGRGKQAINSNSRRGSLLLIARLKWRW